MHQKYLLILFYSATGAVKNLAHAIADGAEKKGLEVKIRTVPKVSAVVEATEPNLPDKGEIYCTKEDLVNCSGLALGSHQPDLVLWQPHSNIFWIQQEMYGQIMN